MSKGSYNVYNPVPTNSKSDNTFWKTFLCSSLVVLVIVLIFLLIALPIKRDLEGIKANIYNAPERRYNSFRKVYSTTPESSQNYDQMSDYDSSDPKYLKETVTQKLKDEVEDVDSTFTQVIEKVTEKNMKLMFKGFTPTEKVEHHITTTSLSDTQFNGHPSSEKATEETEIPTTLTQITRQENKLQTLTESVSQETVTGTAKTFNYPPKTTEETNILTTPSQITRQVNNLQTSTESVSQETVTETAKTFNYPPKTTEETKILTTPSQITRQVNNLQTSTESVSQETVIETAKTFNYPPKTTEETKILTTPSQITRQVNNLQTSTESVSQETVTGTAKTFNYPPKTTEETKILTTPSQITRQVNNLQTSTESVSQEAVTGTAKTFNYPPKTTEETKILTTPSQITRQVNNLQTSTESVSQETVTGTAKTFNYPPKSTEETKILTTPSQITRQVNNLQTSTESVSQETVTGTAKTFNYPPKTTEETKILTTPSQITRQENNLQTSTESVSQEAVTGTAKTFNYPPKSTEETKILTTPSQITRQENNLQTSTESVSQETVTGTAKTFNYPPKTTEKTENIASDYFKTSTNNYYNSISTMLTESNHEKTTEYKYEEDKYENSSNTVYSYEICQKIFDENQYCSTEDCKKISSRMLMSMSFSTDPCSDYYKYSCEGLNQDYVNDHDYAKDVYKRIKDGLSEVNETSPYYLLMYKNYLTSCMNHAYSDPTQQVKEAFKYLGYEFIHEKATTDSSLDIPKLEVLMVDLIKRNVIPFFDVYVDIGFRENSNLTSLVLQPVYFEDIFNDLLGDYKNYEKACVRKLSLESPPNTVTYDSFYLPYHECKKQMFFKDFNTALKTVDGFMSNEQRSKISHDFEHFLFDKMVNTKILDKKIILADKKYETHEISIISKEIPNIDWEFIVTNLIMKNVKETNITVNVYHFDYLKDLLTFESSTGITIDVRRRLHNTLLALYAYKLYKDFILSQSRIGVDSDYCYSLANKLMNDVSSFLYIESFDDSEIRYMHSRTNGVFHQTKTAYESIKNSPWNKHMNNYVIKNPITVQNNKPWTDRSKFNQRFTMINITEDNFIQNTMDLEKRYRHLNYETFNKSVYEADILWSLIASPTDNTLSHISLNDSIDIVMPLAAIPRMKTFIDVPSYIVLSDLSYKIAKEIIYCILTPENRVNDNVRDIFNYSIPFSLSNKNNEESTVYLNTSSSSKDLFSSVYGAWISYDAYISSKFQGNKPNQTLIWQKDSPDQLFFLHLSQGYCKKESILENPVALFESDRLPPLFTVNSIMGNNQDFGILYNCSATPMANTITTSDQDSYGTNYVDFEG